MTGSKGIQGFRGHRAGWNGIWPQDPGGGLHAMGGGSSGTGGDDMFTGTDGDDAYHGLDGKDVISGGAGKDHLFGNHGDDRIDGGDDHDRIVGGFGDDVLKGGGGDDVIKFGTGHDVAHGGDGNDSIFIQSDSADGGDKLYGGAGEDVMGDVFSSLYGGDGDDDLLGYGSIMKGGAGADILRINGAFLQDDYVHEVWGGSGADTFIFNGGGNTFLQGNSEEIHDLRNEDRIDISQFDALPSSQHPGDQAFRLVPQFDGQAGEVTVTYDAASGRTLIELYTNADNMPDGVIWTPGDHSDFTNFAL